MLLSLGTDSGLYIVCQYFRCLGGIYWMIYFPHTALFCDKKAVERLVLEQTDLPQYMGIFVWLSNLLELSWGWDIQPDRILITWSLLVSSYRWPLMSMAGFLLVVNDRQILRSLFILLLTPSFGLPNQCLLFHDSKQQGKTTTLVIN